MAFRRAAMCLSTRSKCAAIRGDPHSASLTFQPFLSGVKLGSGRRTLGLFGSSKEGWRSGGTWPGCGGPRLAQAPVLCWVFWPALHERQVEHKAILRFRRLEDVVSLCRADDVSRQRSERAMPSAIVNDAPVCARSLDGVDALFVILDRVTDCARKLVECELIINASLAPHGSHAIAPLGGDFQSARVSAEEHHASVKPG
eukprot:scaffold14149_cov27-Tisochrysis_lutea.AAC.2